MLRGYLDGANAGPQKANMPVQNKNLRVGKSGLGRYPSGGEREFFDLKPLIFCKRQKFFDAHVCSGGFFCQHGQGCSPGFGGVKYSTPGALGGGGGFVFGPEPKRAAAFGLLWALNGRLVFVFMPKSVFRKAPIVSRPRPVLPRPTIRTPPVLIGRKARP